MDPENYIIWEAFLTPTRVLGKVHLDLYAKFVCIFWGQVIFYSAGKIPSSKKLRIIYISIST
jgi:hypothetical protein